MTKFGIKADNYTEAYEIKLEAIKFGYEAIQPITNGVFFLFYDGKFIDKEGKSAYEEVVKDLDDKTYFHWGTMKKEAIKFMKENSPLGMQIKKEKEIKVEYATKFWQKVMNPDTSHIQQLEQRIRELEIKQITDLDDVNKRMRAIDRKLRSRIQMLESQFDLAINNPVTVEGKDIVMSFSRYNSSTNHVTTDTLNKISELEDLTKGKSLRGETSKPKIAIRVENEEEFNELMIIMEGKGWWLWCDKEKFTGTSYFGKCEYGGRVCVYFNPLSSWFYENDKCSAEIIPFQTLKAILS